MGGGAAAACFGAYSDVDADAACDYSEHSHDDSVRTTNASDDSPPSPRVAAAPHAANGAPLPCAEFDLAVAVWPGPAQFVRTKVVTVSLRLLCRNACPFPVQVAQAHQMETQQQERLVATLYLSQQLLLVVAVAQVNQRKLAVEVQGAVQAIAIQH